MNSISTKSEETLKSGRPKTGTFAAIALIAVVVVIAVVLLLGGSGVISPFDDDEEPPTSPTRDLDSDGDGMPDVWELLWSDPDTQFHPLDPHDPTDMFEDPDNDGYDFDESGSIDGTADMVVHSRLDLPQNMEYIRISIRDLLEDPSGYDGMAVFLDDVFVMRQGDEGSWYGQEVEIQVADNAADPAGGWMAVTLRSWSNRPVSLEAYDPGRGADSEANSRVDVQGTFWEVSGNLFVDVQGGEMFTNVMEYQAMYYIGDPTRPPSKRTDTMYNMTSPVEADSDGDGMSDGWEAWYGDWARDTGTNGSRWSVLDPTTGNDDYLDPDADAIGTRWDLVKWLWVDEDGNGISEPPNGNNPFDAVIIGYNIHEFIIGTNPRVADTDADMFHLMNEGGMDDFDEILHHGTKPLVADTDGDGIPDGFEVYYNLDPCDAYDGGDDPDEDGLSNYQEFLHDTHPWSPDTDGDLMPDGWEVDQGLAPKDPMDAVRDDDGEGLINLMEYLNGTDPWNADTDGDLLTDFEEVTNKWTVVVDGVTRHYCSDPLNGDSDADDGLDDEDGDGNSDPNEEVLDGFDNDGDAEILQNNGIDDDGDGVVDDGRPGIPVVGWAEGVDEEHDFNDYNEVHVYRTNATDQDTDDDGLDDWTEWFTDLDPGVMGVQRTQPLLSDTDSDGLEDGIEVHAVHIWLPDHTDLVSRKTDPLMPDSDSDGLSDGEEVLFDYLPDSIAIVNSTDPLNEDTDGDGMSDSYELWYSDIDGDGLPSLWEMEFSGVYKGAELTRDVNNDGHMDALEDWDGDGLVNVEEFMWRTDPWNFDTDDDGVGDKLDFASTRRHLLPIKRLPIFSDGDGDHMPDWWEVMNGLDPDYPGDAAGDPDFDLLVNVDEYIYDLDPNNKNTDGDEELDLMDHEIMSSPDAWDSDGDGIADWYERKYSNILDPTDPSDADRNSDGDGWTNLEEWIYARDPYNHVPTDPTQTSSDNDDTPDDEDLFPIFIATTIRPLNPTRGTGPLHPLTTHLWDGQPQAAADMDQDLINNSGERLGPTGATDPTDPDTDADGMPDGWEIIHALWDPLTGKPNLDPLNASDAFLDPDWDGINYSFHRDTNGDWIITFSDRDGDGFWDPTYENETFCNLEEYMFGVDPDRDGINERTSHPNMVDTDGDEIIDGWEVLLNDADGDLMSSWFELVYGLDPLWPLGDDGADGDPDDDGRSNLQEFLDNTDPTDPDS